MEIKNDEQNLLFHLSSSKPFLKSTDWKYLDLITVTET